MNSCKTQDRRHHWHWLNCLRMLPRGHVSLSWPSSEVVWLELSKIKSVARSLAFGGTTFLAGADGSNERSCSASQASNHGTSVVRPRTEGGVVVHPNTSSEPGVERQT